MGTDPLVQKLEAAAQTVETLAKKQISLKQKQSDGTLTSNEKIELDGMDQMLADARKLYDAYVALAVKPPESKTFAEADLKWIQEVTGVNTTYREWIGYVLDESIRPGPEFRAAFERIGKAFHQHNEAGRRIFLNLFLGDIILRPEFDGKLRIFPELEVAVVETSGQKKRKLRGRTDYTVGFCDGTDMFDNSIPDEIHLIAVEAKVSIGHPDLWQCVAEAASLYKIRVDAGKAKKSVWGVLSNAELWRFIFIDEDGLLWQSEDLTMSLRRYDESKVLPVYRMVHYIVKQCHQACTPPPSAVSSVESLRQ